MVGLANLTSALKDILLFFHFSFPLPLKKCSVILLPCMLIFYSKKMTKTNKANTFASELTFSNRIDHVILKVVQK